jgi:autotransporter-associated beta strand protein
MFEPTATPAALNAFDAVNNAGTIDVIGSSTSTATLAFNDAMTNSGSLTFSATGSPTTVADVMEGAMLNAATGTVTLDTSTKFEDGVTNNGTFDIAAGATMTFEDTNDTFMLSGGTLTVAGVLSLGEDDFTYNGGQVSGTVTLGVSSELPVLALDSGAGNSGTFLITGDGATIETNTSTVSIQSNQTLMFEPTATTTAALNVFDPVANAGTIDVIGSSTSTATLAFNDAMTNSGSLTFSASGTPTTVADVMEGALINAATGTVTLDTSTKFEDGVTNNGTFDIAAGATMTFEDTGDTFALSGGMLSVAGVLSLGEDDFAYNGGQISGTVTLGENSELPVLTLDSGAGNSGTFLITGQGAQIETNTSTVSIQSNQTLMFEPTATTTAGLISFDPVTNAGTIDVTGSSTSTATLNFETLTNSGSLTFSAMGSPTTVTDVNEGTLVNASAGIVNVDASTLFQQNVTNNGTFDVAAGATMTFSTTSDTFTQSGGTLAVTGVLNMVGGDFNYNGGSINGTVMLGETSGTPTLTLGSGAGNSGAFLLTGEGAVVTGTTSPISIQSNQTITFQPTAPTGTMDLLEATGNVGTIDIIGSGSSTATLECTQTLTNNGTVILSASGSPTGVVDVVEGTLVNLATGTLDIQSSPTFSSSLTTSGTVNVSAGAVLNLSTEGLTLNGGTMMLAAGTSGAQAELKLESLTFSGSSGTGTIASGPVGPGQTAGLVDLAGALVSFNIGAGSAAEQVVISAPISGTELQKTGAGGLELTGANTYSGPTSVTAGTLVIGANGALPANNSVSITGGMLQLATGTGLAQVGSLSITGSGILDITDNHVIITYSGTDPIATILGYLETGFNNGGWNGPGIISSTAQSLTNGLRYGVGWADGNDGTHAVSGLSSGQIELKYTLLGDANLDGTVNGSDFSILAANFGTGVTNWDQGNFFYGSSVNGSDFSALAANFGQGDSGADVSVSQADVSALDAFAAANGLPLPVIGAVPEPASAALALMAGAGLLARRRRRG